MLVIWWNSGAKLVHFCDILLRVFFFVIFFCQKIWSVLLFFVILQREMILTTKIY